MPPTVPPAVTAADRAAAGRPPERAQVVWQAAVDLAGDGPGVALALLRAADFDPSTLRHALTLGRTLRSRHPHDARLRNGQALLERATDWLGVRDSAGEVGSALSGRTHHDPGDVQDPSDEERPVTAHPQQPADDDLSRQRRKRDERLLAQALTDEPGVTVGDLVAEVAAAIATEGEGDGASEFNVPAYLAEQGHTWSTIKTVVDYLERQGASRGTPPSGRATRP